MKKVFIDGQYGTTGLKIHERLQARPDIRLIEIAEADRKDPKAKEKILNDADFVFLCLPDTAAKESVALIKNKSVCIIDGSTAHRVAEGWVYGLPELNKEQRSLIKNSKRIAVPGCHATAFVALVYPLINKGIIDADYPVSCHTLAGYSGGGKAMIAEYEGENVPDYIKNPRPYSLGLAHKHIPEMTKITGLSQAPLFAPTVVNVYNGEILSVPLIGRHMKKKFTAGELRDVLANYYSGERFIKVMPYPADFYLKNGCMTFADCNGTNNLEIFVFGDQDKILLSARFDNLGKGASGAAMQNMNIVLGVDEATGL